MLIGHDVDVAALLDGDEPARKEGKKLIEKLLAGEDRKCLFIGDFTVHPGAELEDIFPEDEYLDAVRVAYPGVKLSLNVDEKALPGVVAKVESFFARKNLGRFEKWRVAAVLRDRVIDSADTVADDTLDIIEQIFTSINGLLPAN
jgi:hypothetical protein